MKTPGSPWRLPLREGRELVVGGLPGVMAILNVTPDSFSDGGKHAGSEAAVAAGCRAADAGAVLVDVGGESTRPRGATYGSGAKSISVSEELARTLPVLRGLRVERPKLPLSIDTRRLEIARAALQAGVDIINLVGGLEPDPKLLAVISRNEAAVILNHCRGTPETTFEVSRFKDVVKEVAADLAAARIRAIAAGISAERVLLDPGLGFGKQPDENFALLSNLHAIAPGMPLVVGASRKAFLGGITGALAAERLPESLAAVTIALPEARVRPILVRVHDVDETLRFLAILSRAAS